MRWIWNFAWSWAREKRRERTDTPVEWQGHDISFTDHLHCFLKIVFTFNATDRPTTTVQLFCTYIPPSQVTKFKDLFLCPWGVRTLMRLLLALQDLIFFRAETSNLDGGLFSNSAFPAIDSQFDQLMAPTAPPASLEAGALLPIHPPPLFLSRPWHVFLSVCFANDCELSPRQSFTWGRPSLSPPNKNNTFLTAFSNGSLWCFEDLFWWEWLLMWRMICVCDGGGCLHLSSSRSVSTERLYAQLR